MDKKQTAVDWLVEQLQAPCRGIPSHILEQAKKMEKEQILDAYGIVETTEQGDIMNAEQYYNETYGK